MHHSIPVRIPGLPIAHRILVVSPRSFRKTYLIESDGRILTHEWGHPVGFLFTKEKKSRGYSSYEVRRCSWEEELRSAAVSVVSCTPLHTTLHTTAHHWAAV